MSFPSLKDQQPPLAVRHLQTAGTSTTRLEVGVFSAMVEKELGERNFGLTPWSPDWTATWSGKGLLPGIVSNSVGGALDFRESKPKFLSPNSFSTMAWDNPHYESRCGSTRDIACRCSLVFSPNGSFMQACVIVLLCVMRHNTNSRKVIQITKKCTMLALLCVYSHTCGTRMVIAHCLMGGPNSLAGQSRERGDNLSPYEDIQGKFQIGPSEL